MKINILTPDSKRPNLAAMKISRYWKNERDNSVTLNSLKRNFNYVYASVLFKSTADPIANEVGGPKYPHRKLLPEIESCKPDYSLYPDIDYSLGYTYRACPRTCEHCIVPDQKNDESHNSIWDFHDSRFKKICLLNNNTLADLYWRETFEEIIDADLIVSDQNGYDARLITEEAGHYISKLKFQGQIHTAWDFPEHEVEVLTGICNLTKYIKPWRISCYVLIGNTTHEENLDRIHTLFAMGITPFVMPLQKQNPYQKAFARWVNRFIYKNCKWEDYKYNPKSK